MTTITERLHALYSAAVHDVMRAMGRDRCVLPPGIRALDPNRKLAGEIATVSGHLDHGVDAHQSLVAWTGLLSKAPPGRVLVCQPHNHEIALMGELSAETLQRKGVLGYLADGGCRDVDSILKLGFPVYCSFYTPKDIVGRWVPERFGEPLMIGEVSIRSGDFILGDRDGVVVIPAELAADVVDRTEDVVRTENKVRTAILEGMDPQQAYLTYGKF